MLSPRVRRLAAYATPALVFAVLVVLMGWRLWWPDVAERRAFNYDAVWQYWGDLVVQIDAYRSGQLPLWNPFDRGGYPIHADPQAGLLYPPNWAILGLGFLVGPVWWLVAVKTLFHLWLTGLGVFAYLKRRGNPTAAAYAGGAILVLLYPISKQYWNALNWSFAWAPWMLLAVDAWAERPDRRRAGLLALAFAMCHLAWAPAASWYALLAIGPYAVWAVASRWSDPSWRKAALGSGGTAIALFLAMVVGQVLSSTQIVPLTVRADRSLDFVTFSVFSPDDLFGLFVPGLPGEMAYLGFAVLLWAAVAVSVKTDARRLVLAGAAVLGLLLAFGQNGPYLASLASGPGPFDLFRRAHRYLYVTTLPLAILAAEGLTELYRAERRRELAIAVGGVGLLGVAISLYGHYAAAPPPLAKAYVHGALVAGGAALVSLAVVLLVGRARQVVFALAALLVCLDLYTGLTWYRERIWDVVPNTAKNDAYALALPGLAEGARVYDRAWIKYRPGTRLGIHDLGGYEDDPLALRRYATVRQLAMNAPRYLAHIGVRYLLEDGKVAPPTRKTPADKAALTTLRPGVYELAAAPPPVYFTDHAASAVDEAAALAQLRASQPGDTVVEGLSAPLTGSAPLVAGRYLRRDLNRVTVEIDAPSAGVVVVHQAFHPGWRARVDGELTPILPANVAWRALEVGPGRHVIEMTYSPRAFLLLAVVSLLALAVAVTMALVPPSARA
jgi:hypothetical protein